MSIGRMCIPVREAFSYGIRTARHIHCDSMKYYFMLHWITMNMPYPMPYPVWKCLPYGSMHPPYSSSPMMPHTPGFDENEMKIWWRSISNMYEPIFLLVKIKRRSTSRVHKLLFFDEDQMKINFWCVQTEFLWWRSDEDQFLVCPDHFSSCEDQMKVKF